MLLTKTCIRFDSNEIEAIDNIVILQKWWVLERYLDKNSKRLVSYMNRYHEICYDTLKYQSFTTTLCYTKLYFYIAELPILFLLRVYKP